MVFDQWSLITDTLVNGVCGLICCYRWPKIKYKMHSHLWRCAHSIDYRSLTVLKPRQHSTHTQTHATPKNSIASITRWIVFPPSSSSSFVVSFMFWLSFDSKRNAKNERTKITKTPWYCSVVGVINIFHFCIAFGRNNVPIHRRCMRTPAFARANGLCWK